MKYLVVILGACAGFFMGISFISPNPEVEMLRAIYFIIAMFWATYALVLLEKE